MILQISKFSLVGLSNFIIDIWTLNLLVFFYKEAELRTFFTFFGLTVTMLSLFKLISFIIANINSFFWNKFWTFQSKNNSKKITEYTKFLLISLLSMIINVLIFSITIEFVFNGEVNNLFITISAAVGSVIGLAFNFAFYKFFVFNKSKI